MLRADRPPAVLVGTLRAARSGGGSSTTLGCRMGTERRTMPDRSVAPRTLLVIALLTVGFAVSFMNPLVASYLALIHCDADALRIALAFLTHFLVFGSILHFLLSAAMLFAAGWIVERYISGWKFAIVLLVPLWATAAAYIVLDTSCMPYVGPMSMSWSLSGCAVGYLLAKWRSITWRGVTYLAVVGLLAARYAFAAEVEVAMMAIALAFGFSVGICAFWGSRGHAAT